MASDSFLQIDGLKGECVDSEHKDWIEIISFSHEIVQPTSATAGSAGGATRGRSKHEDFSVTKYIDLSTPKLLEMCSSGKHIKKITLEMMRSSGDAKVKYMLIELDQVVVSRVTMTGGTGEDLPTETVSFNYGVIKWTYTQQKRADGSKGGNVAAGWDLTAGKTAA